MYINKLLSILYALCVSMSLSAQTELYVATTGNDVTGNPDIGAYEYGSPLPVQLLRFDGKATPKGNHLTWATAQETAFKAFELQRAKEDLDFKTLETITAKGSNSVYEYWDESQGLTYYRLKIKDLDGRLEYSMPSDNSYYNHPISFWM